MSKFRIVYIISLLLLGALVVFTVFRPMATGEKYSEVGREHLLQTEDEYIVEFDIMNHEGKVTNYLITALINGQQYDTPVSIKDGRKFTYIYHIYPDQSTGGGVSFTIYKEGEDTPFEQITYYLDSHRE